MLFRPEALDARDAQHLGTIRLARSPGRRTMAALALVVVALVAGFAWYGTYTRRATVPGFLEPAGGTLRLLAAASGVVAEVRVVEGAVVTRGAVLFVLSGDRWSTRGESNASIARQLAARRAALDVDARLVDARDALRTRTAEERLGAIDAEGVRLAHEADLHAARRRIAVANVQRYETLAATGYVAQAQVQARRDELLVVDATLDDVERQRSVLGRERVGLVGQVAESRLQAEAERGDVARQRALLEQEGAENDARSETVVVAPRDGTVTALAAHAGQRVVPGTLLATLIRDDAPVQAQLYATARQVGFVETGQRVRLRYAAYPYQKFGMGEGVVASVEKSPYAPQELPAQVAAALGAPALAGGEALYRIGVTLESQTIQTYGRAQRLRAGLVFDADVLQDRRTLFEWWLEPLYGVAAR